MRVFLLLISLLLPNYVLASSQGVIQSRELKHNLSEDEFSKIDLQTQEIQNLIGRVEVLEHNLSHLQQRLESIDKALGEGKTLQSLGQVDSEASTQTNEQNLQKSNDVFDAATPKTQVDNAAPPTPAEKSLNKKAAPKSDDKVNEKQQYDLALAALKDNKLEEAEKQFANFIKKYPKSSLQSNAYFWYGETYYKRRVFDKAAINYLKGYKQFPKGAKAADSLLKLALSLGELNKKPEACQMLSKLDEVFSSRPAASIKRANDAKVKFGCK